MTTGQAPRRREVSELERQIEEAARGSGPPPDDFVEPTINIQLSHTNVNVAPGPTGSRILSLVHRPTGVALSVLLPPEHAMAVAQMLAGDPAGGLAG